MLSWDNHKDLAVKKAQSEVEIMKMKEDMKKICDVIDTWRISKASTLISAEITISIISAIVDKYKINK